MDEVLSLPKPYSVDLAEIRLGGQRNEDLVAELYTRLRAPLLSYVYHLIGSTRDAEDIVQVAFIQLFDQLNSQVQIRNVRGWIYRVVHNIAIDIVRSGERRDVLFTQWLADYRPPEESIEQDLIRRDQIERSLSMLNEREQRCLMLRAEGLSYQEIADVLDISAKSVSVYLARGLKKFEARNEEKR
jgi:RNA polymerase sigma-70 factor, ECF subfamily